MTLMDLLLRAIRPKTNHSWTSVVVAVGLGMAAGVIGGVLFAPRSGEGTRAIIAGKAKDLASRAAPPSDDAPAKEE